MLKPLPYLIYNSKVIAAEEINDHELELGIGTKVPSRLGYVLIIKLMIEVQLKVTYSTIMINISS